MIRVCLEVEHTRSEIEEAAKQTSFGLAHKSGEQAAGFAPLRFFVTSSGAKSAMLNVQEFPLDHLPLLSCNNNNLTGQRHQDGSKRIPQIYCASSTWLES